VFAVAVLVLLAALSACAGPQAAAPPALPTAPVPAAPLAQAAPAAANCAPSAIQPSEGAAVYLVARVAGCPELIVVEWNGAELRMPADVLLATGLHPDVLAALPERETR